jgi:dUTPase
MYITLLPSLKETLEESRIEKYGPAYQGTSVGFDLWNTGEDIILPTLDSLGKTQDQLFKKLIPTGLKTAIPLGYCGLILERSSIVKTTLKVRAGVIDPGYTGEIFINAVNLGKSDVMIPKHSITPFQLVIVKTSTDFSIVSEEAFEALTKDSLRGDKAIGSSQKG